MDNFVLMELTKVARKIVRKCVNIQPWEQVLLLTDPTTDKMVDVAMATAAKETGADVYVLTMRPPEVPNEQPLPVVRAALEASDVYIMHMRYDIIHPFAIHALCKDYGVRVCYMPALRTRQMLSPAVAEIDHEELRDFTKRVGDKVWRGRKEMRITDKLGTDFTAKIMKGSKIGCECGLCLEPGETGCHPPGGTEIDIERSTANGVVVFEAYHMFGRLSEPIRMTLKDGDVEDVQGGWEARVLRKLFKEKKDARYLFHVGGPGTNWFGTYPGLPELIEDKHSLGPLHVGFGGGASAISEMHTDGIIYKPTIEVDGEVVEEDGVIKVER